MLIKKLLRVFIRGVLRNLQGVVLRNGVQGEAVDAPTPS